jgi:hypothetical protein
MCGIWYVWCEDVNSVGYYQIEIESNKVGTSSRNQCKGYSYTTAEGKINMGERLKYEGQA